MTLLNKLKDFLTSGAISQAFKKIGSYVKPIIATLVGFFTRDSKPKARAYAARSTKSRFEEASNHADLIYKLTTDLEQGKFSDLAYGAAKEYDKVLSALSYPVKLYADYLHYQKLNNESGNLELPCNAELRIEVLDDVEAMPKLKPN